MTWGLPPHMGLPTPAPPQPAVKAEEGTEGGAVAGVTAGEGGQLVNEPQPHPQVTGTSASTATATETGAGGAVVGASSGAPAPQGGSNLDLNLKPMSPREAAGAAVAAIRISMELPEHVAESARMLPPHAAWAAAGSARDAWSLVRARCGSALAGKADEALMGALVELLADLHAYDQGVCVCVSVCARACVCVCVCAALGRCVGGRGWLPPGSLSGLHMHSVLCILCSNCVGTGATHVHVIPPVSPPPPSPRSRAESVGKKKKGPLEGATAGNWEKHNVATCK